MIWLLFAHFIGDYALQNDYLASNKGHDWYILFAHAMIWTACVTVALLFIGHCATWKGWVLIIPHMASDLAKARRPDVWPTFCDQALHFGQLALVYLT